MNGGLQQYARVAAQVERDQGRAARPQPGALLEARADAFHWEGEAAHPLEPGAQYLLESDELSRSLVRLEPVTPGARSHRLNVWQLAAAVDCGALAVVGRAATTSDRTRQLLALRAASPARAAAPQADAAHLPLFVAANEPRLI